MAVCARSVSGLSWGLAGLVSAILFGPSPARAQAYPTFRNPLFQSQDPYVTWWQGNYYYSDSDGDAIFIRKSVSLTGLRNQRPRSVWTSSRRGWDGHANVWAPEIHILDGKPYIYFAADYRTDGRHRLYVLEGGTDPAGSYVAGDTGAPDGQLVESTDGWAIDPNVFYGHDGQLYIAWSCADNEIGQPPTSLCLARMSDPLHIASPTVRISTASEAWEARTGAIEEGPVGFARNGSTYITFSASASWTTNDYAVGLLVNAGGDLLDPGAWVKQGPIFDRHGKVYGPGSVVFVPSPDGTETWNLYHAYDRLDCAMWACRSIRAQRMSWAPGGTPLLGYPVDPGVPAAVPSGDAGSPTGWGDSRAGARASGSWTYRDNSSLDCAWLPGDGPCRSFRGGTDAFAYTVSADVGLGDDGPAGRYGIYALYRDEANHVEGFFDTAQGIFGTSATVAGIDQGLRVRQLPGGFDSTALHTLKVQKSAAQEFVFYLDGVPMDRRFVSLDRGQCGVFAEGGARFRQFTFADARFGWGDASGDAAAGLARGDAPQFGDGYVQGGWEIVDQALVRSVDSGPGWHTLYQGSPAYESYAVQVEAQAEPADRAKAGRYGLIVCHDDRNNQASMWIDPGQGVLTTEAIVAGQASSRSVALPYGFEAGQAHVLKAVKSASVFAFYLDGQLLLEREIGLVNGSAGVATENTRAGFRNFSLSYGRN